jgi:hypothetical protein
MSRDIVPINERDLFWKDPFFSTTWDEFDKMRTDMMAKSKEFWDNCNKDMANFDDAVRKSHLDMDMGMAPFRPQLPSWAMPDSIKDKWAPMMTKANDEVRINLTTLEMLRKWLDETKLPKHGNIIKVFHTLCNLKVTQDAFSSIWMLQNTLSNCKKF